MTKRTEEEKKKLNRETDREFFKSLFEAVQRQQRGPKHTEPRKDPRSILVVIGPAIHGRTLCYDASEGWDCGIRRRVGSGEDFKCQLPIDSCPGDIVYIGIVGHAGKSMEKIKDISYENGFFGGVDFNSEVSEAAKFAGKVIAKAIVKRPPDDNDQWYYDELEEDGEVYDEFDENESSHGIIGDIELTEPFDMPDVPNGWMELREFSCRFIHGEYESLFMAASGLC